MNDQPLPNVPLSPPATSTPRSSSATPVWLVAGGIVLAVLLLGCVALVVGFLFLGARYTSAVTAREQAVQLEAEAVERARGAEQEARSKMHEVQPVETAPSPR